MSSTFTDLRAERAAVRQVLERMGVQAVSQEGYVAESACPLDKCLADVRSCAMYIGIFAWRYGYIPPGCEQSITDLEYRAARDAGLPVLIFLLDPQAPWPPPRMDDDLTRIRALRAELATDLLCSIFTTSEELASLVGAAVHNRLHLPRSAADDSLTADKPGSTPRRPLPAAKQVPAPEILIGVPRRPATQFLGREQALTALRARLATGAGVITQAIVGLGGVGKSELALQYARRHREDYRLVWWVEAETPAQIQAGLASLARVLAAGADPVAAEQATPDEAAAWTLEWLNTHTGWLVIFDNVEEAADIELYLARLASGHVVITTRRDVGWQQTGITPLRLDLLERPASIDLLADLIGPSAAGQTPLLDQLADQLGDLPLALRQAGAYITRTPRITLARYLQLLQQTPTRVHAAVPTGGDAARAVADVWALSCERIRLVNPLALHVLNLLTCYAPDNLPVTVLDGLAEADDLVIGEALALLASYSLITLTTTSEVPAGQEPHDLISVHRLIQATVQAQIPDDQRETIGRQATTLLQAALPDDPEQMANWPSYRLLLPHARTVLPPDSSGLAQVRDYLEASGDPVTALDIQHQIHLHHLHISGPEHADTLNAQHDLAYYVGEAGDAAAARDQLAALLPIEQHLLGTDHPSTLITRDNLAGWTGQAGDAAAARDQLAALLPIRERVLGTDHPDTLITQHELAGWTGEAGDTAAARDQLAALLPIEQHLLGIDHPDTLTTQHELAAWTGEAGDMAAARDQLAALLPIRERVLGTDHPSTLITRDNLAHWTGQAGDAAAARDQLAALLPIRERVLGTDHPSTLITRYNLAHWTKEAGDQASENG
ncbi:tetratricopeptide repeat protein [Nonomuraea insulae]|uniref:tetratricopeptide repeat protein n=1 Tax=Nonomuraea insulae TaxID=1616787 RepID=UPI0036D2895C